MFDPLVYHSFYFILKFELNIQLKTDANDTLALFLIFFFLIEYVIDSTSILVLFFMRTLFKLFFLTNLIGMKYTNFCEKTHD